MKELQEIDKVMNDILTNQELVALAEKNLLGGLPGYKDTIKKAATRRIGLVNWLDFVSTLLGGYLILNGSPFWGALCVVILGFAIDWFGKWWRHPYSKQLERFREALGIEWRELIHLSTSYANFPDLAIKRMQDLSAILTKVRHTMPWSLNTEQFEEVEQAYGIFGELKISTGDKMKFLDAAEDEWRQEVLKRMIPRVMPLEPTEEKVG